MRIEPSGFVDEAREAERWTSADWAWWLRLRERLETTWEVRLLQRIGEATVAAYDGLPGMAFGVGDGKGKPLLAAVDDVALDLHRKAETSAAIIVTNLGLNPWEAFRMEHTEGWASRIDVVKDDEVLGSGPTRLHAAKDAELRAAI